MNFAVASLRSAGEDEIIKKFVHAYYEDRVLAMKGLFFLRDIRGGLGERRTFRVILRYLAVGEQQMVERLIPLIAEYGRFDDLLCLFDTPAEEKMLALLKQQLLEDITHMEKKQQISLCAKWIPSINASAKETRKKARRIVQYLEITAREYRRLLAILREYLSVTEVLASANRWDEITYEAVPSNANLRYYSAFMRHDEARRKNYLESVQKGEKTIHAGVLMPHEIVTRYCNRQGWRLNLKKEEPALEELWRHLDNTMEGAEDVLCIVDGSGSMLCPVGDGTTTALQVSNALGIYFAEHLKGAYHNQFITFSDRPQYVNLNGCRTLREKLAVAFSHNDISNTNLEASFNLILQTAVSNHLSQDELPKTVLVISDMEFDQATVSKNRETLFQSIGRNFARYGYRMPKLVFWNCNSRTNVIPVRENALGVALVSGFSVNVCRMVLGNQLDPYACLKAQLESERYAPIGQAV